MAESIAPFINALGKRSALVFANYEELN